MISDTAHRRLHNQRIAATAFETPAEVVGWLGAMQAQDYAGAKWAVGLRMKNATDAAVEAVFDAGLILRTHIMRPTWHFVTPQDIRWMLELTAPRVHAVNAYMYRKLECDDVLLGRSGEVLAKALEGGQRLTRPELGKALAQAGIIADGMRLGYIVHHAELEAIVCSGGRRGKQFTYALLDEQAPNASKLERDEALAELTRRYFTSHGPATVADFAWWSGLTVVDVKAGLAMCRGQLTEAEIDGRVYWMAEASIAQKAPSPTLYLLPPFDEYGIAYRDHTATMDDNFLEQARNNLYGGAIVSDGEGIGYWGRTFVKKQVVVEPRPFRPLTPAELEGVAAEAERFGAFLKMPAVLTA